LFGIFEENINKELSEKLPFLATTQILIECVKAEMGREVDHEMIKKMPPQIPPVTSLAH
jgi:adenylosuccinate lyase